jgi:hypothetical protein
MYLPVKGTAASQAKKIKKNSKKRLTNPPTCGIIKTVKALKKLCT